jgi:hypothetical protein
VTSRVSLRQLFWEESKALSPYQTRSGIRSSRRQAVTAPGWAGYAFRKRLVLVLADAGRSPFSVV